MRSVGFVSAVTALALSCAAACGDSNTPVTPSPAAMAADVALGTDPDVARLVAAVRQATARYHDVSVAHAAGYATANEPCVASPAGGMGVHAANMPLLVDPALDPTVPELLLYEPKPNGLKLVAVEYLKFVPLRNRTTGAVGPWVSQSPWDPALYEVAIPTPQLFGQTFNGPMPGHTPTMPWHWDLHAWIWTPNPNGMFVQFNPSVQCN